MARRLSTSPPDKSRIRESPGKWWLLLLLSASMAALFIRMVPESLRTHEIIDEGKYVTVNIAEVRTSTFGRRSVHSLTFHYRGYKGNVNIGYRFFNQIQGKKIARMLHSDKYPELFIPPVMPPDYNDKNQFYSFIVVTCISIFAALFSAYKIYSISGKHT